MTSTDDRARNDMSAVSRNKPAEEIPGPTDGSIAFVLDHPEMSQWLKDALAAARDRRPFEVLNDLEILSQIVRARADRVNASRP